MSSKANQGTETVGDKSAASFWSEFETALATGSQKSPSGRGWMTVNEWVAASGLGRSATSGRLMRGLKSGLLERFEGTAHQDGRLVRAVWYRRKKGA